MILICIYLNDVENLFKGFLADASSSLKCMFKSFTHFLLAYYPFLAYRWSLNHLNIYL